MADYYSILGVPKTATESEIKTAFRKLAKLYHPDKNPNNPNAKSYFQTILKAYNVLSNPNSKRRYDLSHSPQKQTTHYKQQHHRTKTGKDRDVSDIELKRREYYRKHYQAKQQTVAQPVANKYSDYKYILFATPLAVGLLMLVISVLNPIPSTLKEVKKPTVVITKLKFDSIDSTHIQIK